MSAGKASMRDTRTRLLDTAERLFAERGIGATSVRDLASAARANLGAVTYHFGSKDALVHAVIERRMLPLNAERLRLLEAAERAASPRSPALEAVLRAILAPTIRLWRENPGFMRMFGRLHAEPDHALRKCAEAAPFFRRVVAAIGRAAPELGPDEIAWGMLFMRGAAINTWTGAERLAAITGLRPQNMDDEAIVDRLVSFGAAGIRAQARPKKPTRSRVSTTTHPRTAR
jgi:AcrR family transcriptional regulator